MNPMPPFFLLFLKCIVLATSRLKKIEEYHVTKVNFTTDGVFPLCGVFPYILFHSLCIIFIHIQENSNGSSTPLSIICVLWVMSSNLFLTENHTLNLMSWQETISMKASTVKYVSCIVCTLVWYAKVEGGGDDEKTAFLMY